eukprot:COSAG02_NODE_8761_length_2453_cov_1.677995_3_plen_151_part_00
MWNRAKELEIPLFAGSSLVVCYRRTKSSISRSASCNAFVVSHGVTFIVPQHLVNPSDFSGALSCMRGRGCLGRPFLEHKKGANIQDALIISGGGPDGYHTLEALQCMVERRAGGEAGVAAVTVLKGADMWCAPQLSCLHIVRVSLFGQYC